MPRIERRQAPRGKTSILTAYRCLENGNVTGMGFGRTLNLSQIGALLEAPDVLVVEQAVELEFLLDENKLVTVMGHVTRLDKVKTFYQAAVEFDKLDAKTRRLIDAQIGGVPKAKPTPRAPASGKTKTKPSAKPTAHSKAKPPSKTQSRRK
jgi:hypothetical protein